MSFTRTVGRVVAVGLAAVSVACGSKLAHDDATGTSSSAPAAESLPPELSTPAACVPSQSAPGKACDHTKQCGAGLVCGLVGSWADGLSPDASVECLEHAGTCCKRDGDCLSGVCEKGKCAESRLDYSCGNASDCVPSGEPYGDAGTYCYHFIHGKCCPLHTLGAPPGCPGA